MSDAMTNTFYGFDARKASFPHLLGEGACILLLLLHPVQQHCKHGSKCSPRDLERANKTSAEVVSFSLGDRSCAGRLSAADRLVLSTKTFWMSLIACTVYLRN